MTKTKPGLKKIMQSQLEGIDLQRRMSETRDIQQSLFDNNEYFTIENVASIVGCSSRTIQRTVKRGELKATKAGKKTLIRKDWVESWLQPKEV